MIYKGESIFGMQSAKNTLFLSNLFKAINVQDALEESKGGMELLWTNPNPSSNFATQTVELNGLDKFDEIRIIAKPSTVSTAMSSSTVDLSKMVTGIHVTTDGTRSHRNFQWLDDGIQVGDGLQNGSTANGVFLPQYIYGIKY